MKDELIFRGRWPTRAMAAEAIAGYIEGFYNTKRLALDVGLREPVGI